MKDFKAIFEKTKWWALLVIAIVIILFMFGCVTSPSKSLGPIPPMDAFNNATGLPGSDGQLDPQFVAYVQSVKTVADTATGGTVSLWTTIAVSLITTVGGVTVALFKDKQDKKEVMQEIKETDKNVETVAKAANVPEERLL